MYAAFLLRDFLLQARLRQDPKLRAEPAALLDADPASGKGHPRILQLNHWAASYRIEPGMTAAHGLARCSHLQLLSRDEAVETAASRELLDVAAAWVPDYEHTAPGIVTLDLCGLADDPEILARDLLRDLKTRGLHATAGIAPSPDLALLAARLADPVEVFDGDPETFRSRLQSVPLSQADPPPHLAPVLQLWGIHTLGDLLAIPRHEAVERLGPEAGTFWDQILGTRPRLLTLVRPPLEFEASHDFEGELDTLEPLLFILRRLLEKLLNRLRAHYLVAAEVDLRLHFAGRRREDYRRLFRVPDPVADVEILFPLLHTHLESFSADEPVVALTLKLTPAHARGCQRNFLETSWKDPNRFADTVARIEALTGSDRTGVPVPRPGHRADLFDLVPFAPNATLPAPPREPDFHLGLPLNRFRPPRPAQVERRSPGPWDPPHTLRSGSLEGAITDCAGPWVVSGEWWNPTAVSRREWDVQLESGALYRLSQCGETWFLEGEYG